MGNKTLDKDGDGLLTWDEFQAGAAENGFGDNKDEQKESFELMDRDKDGYISFEDFKNEYMKRAEGQQYKSDKEWRQVQLLLNKPHGK